MQLHWLGTFHLQGRVSFNYKSIHEHRRENENNITYHGSRYR